MAGKGIEIGRKPVTCVHIITRMDKGGSAENTFLTVKHLNRGLFDPVLIIGPSTESAMLNEERRAVGENLQGLVKDGIKVLVCPFLFRRISPCHDLMAFWWIFWAIRHLKPQIVHTHTSKAGILGRWAAFLNRVPLICHTPHGHIFYGYFGPLLRTFFIWLERLTARITHRIICLTEGEMEDHLRLRIAPGHVFLVCPSGVDIRHMQEGVSPSVLEGWRERLGIGEEDLVIGTMGRHVQVKGHDILLAASREILDCVPNALFCFLGSGPLKEELERMAWEWGINRRVRFIPWESDPRPILDLFDIFVFPSLNEGMGRALVEAMAMKKPVVAARTGGIPDLVHEGENGFLVPPADATSLADAILWLAGQPGERDRMGEAGERLARRFSLDSMVETLEGMYQELLEGHPHARTSYPIFNKAGTG